MRIIILLLLISFVVQPALSQNPSKKETQERNVICNQRIENPDRGR